MISITQVTNEIQSTIAAASNSSYGSNTEPIKPIIAASITLSINRSTHHSNNDLIAQQIDERIQQLVAEDIDQIIISMLNAAKRSV